MSISERVAHVRYTFQLSTLGFPPLRLLTFTSALRAFMAVVLANALTFLAVDVATFGRIKCAATPGDISSENKCADG